MPPALQETMPSPSLPNEKALPVTDLEGNIPRSRSALMLKHTRFVRWLAFALIVVQGWACLYPDQFANGVQSLGSLLQASSAASASNAALCGQVEPLAPVKNGDLWAKMGDLYSTDKFLLRAVDWLGGAVRVPTESYDAMDPVGVDPRWEVFGPFHDYLLKVFPSVHSTLQLTKVNTYGLVYEWKGSDADLKPLLLMAHQDVVPVNPDTVGEWTHPPYSGYFDGGRIWGRGSSDDKSGLIGIMSTIETLLEVGFKPTRSVVLSFGFDEEASGVHGAQANAQAILEMYGENAFDMIVDEGEGFAEQYGGIFAVPGIAEKGYLDVRVDISTPGGHSSVPPPHTSIGMISRLLVEYENSPYEVHLSRGTPVYETVQCLAAYAPELAPELRKAIKASTKSDKALRAAEKELLKERQYNALIGTTQAIDIIHGGVKTNALPEQAYAVVNHRIATDSSVEATRKHDTKLLEGLAATFNLSYTAFGKQISALDAPAYGSLVLSDLPGTALNPAPVTPTTGKPYQLLSGTIRATYNAHRALEGENIFVSPGIMTGNTDTRYYWKLSKHIFRYNHSNGGKGGGLGGIHTVNESIHVDAFLEMIRFFSTLILNVDEAKF